MKQTESEHMPPTLSLPNQRELPRVQLAPSSIVTRIALSLTSLGAILFLYWTLSPHYAEITIGLFGGGILGALISLSITENVIKLKAKNLFSHTNDGDLEPPTREENQSGLAVLDELLDNYRESHARFADTLKLIGEEAESLIERYEVLTENLAAAIVIRDEDGKITYCSPYTEVFTGSSLSEIYKSPTDFFIQHAHEEDQDKFKRALSVSSLGEAFQFRYRFIHKTGIHMWAEMRTVPIFSEESKFLGTLSITLDITGTMRYQQQVEERNKDLQEFSYMISHDLKAPIFTIKGMMNVLHEDHKDLFEGERGEILGHVEKAADRLSTLVSAVLEYSKVTTRQISPEPVDLNTVIKEVLYELEPSIKTAEADIFYQQNLPHVIGDKLMVYQIISNLVGNSVKYRDPNRALKIRITSEGKSTRGFVSLTIADSGMGISQEKIEGLFRPFQRAHSGSIEGSGIGLACVKKLLQKLGGSVMVDSKEGVGTAFTIKIPIARDIKLETRAR
jgi:PAS domain S-box-containing protein